MKRLLLLFPLYILFLSGVPCSPNDGCCQEELQAAAKQPTADHNNTRDKKSDLPCSPFFPCGACHGVIVPNHAVQVIQLPAPVIKQPSLYIEKPLLAFTPPIWQPPKRA